jgi:hypothetical protein
MQADISIRSTASALTDYLSGDFATLTDVKPIMAALTKYGNFSDSEARAALQADSGPTVLALNGSPLGFFDARVKVSDPSITINPSLATNFNKTFTGWPGAASERDRNAAIMGAQLGFLRPDGTDKLDWFDNSPGRTVTEFGKVFFVNKSGKRVWAVGAVLLEALVRLGAQGLGSQGRPVKEAEARKRSTAFQKEVYGEAIVDDGRRFLQAG